MTPTNKTLLAGAMVLCASAAVVVGVFCRDRVDMGGTSVTPVDGLVASRGDEVPEGDYFYEISQLLKQRYVEPITDEQKLALGAIRGMVTSLGDPDSLYMDKDEYRVFENAKQGKYEGIGVQLELIYDKPADKGQKSAVAAADSDEVLLGGLRIPKLTVVTVVPGSPADKAGLKPGDWIEYVDDHWVPNADTVASFRRLQRDVVQGKAKMEQLVKVRAELKVRTKRTLLPLKAKDRLVMGDNGSVKLTWQHSGVAKSATIAKHESVLSGFKDEGGVIQLQFFKGSDDLLRKAVADKAEVTIDLRNNANGDLQTMKNCLALLAPSGNYGVFKSNKKSVALSVLTGATKRPKVTLLVDGSTRGLAEIFALALSSHDLAKLSGPKMAGHQIVVEDSSLPEGAGYTLATAEYQVAAK